MVDLDERKSDLLDLIIRDYIKTARPVASGRLVQEYELEMSPATARNEMLALDDLGYLEQRQPLFNFLFERESHNLLPRASRRKSTRYGL